MRFGLILAFVALTSCANPAAADIRQISHLKVVTSTTLLASLARQVGGTRADVSALIPIGASPETYQPAPLDVATLSAAEVIVENGAGLDRWIDPLVANARGSAIVIRMADGLPVIDGNPHLWLDPDYARRYLEKMRDAFTRADPAGASTYQRNADRAGARIAALTSRIERAVGTIPPAQRKMIVFHNAWLYYNRRFGIQTLGIVEEHPGTEPSAEHVARLVDALHENHVRTIFAEPEYNPKLIAAIARSAGSVKVAVLYDDSVTAAGPAQDYVGMLDLDTATIVSSLQ
jgi:manganese/iron transport system substrate-binding protein